MQNLPYVQALAEKSTILAIQEHWMYGYEEDYLKSLFTKHNLVAKFHDL